MTPVNVWIALSSTAKDILAPLLSDSSYSGQHLTAVRIFRHLQNRSVVTKLFREGTFGGKTWVLFDINLDVSQNPQRAKEAIDYLTENYANNFQVVGAWHWDGRQVGTQWERDQEGNIVADENGVPQTTGTPTYPIPAAQLLKIMPQDVDWSDPDNPVYSEPTELKQVHLIQGQSPRRWV